MSKTKIKLRRTTNRSKGKEKSNIKIDRNEIYV